MQHTDDMVQERREMVELLRRYGIRNPRVLEAFLTVKRHLFVDGESRMFAYHDSALPIGFGQTISQPYTVAYMMELLVENCSSGKVLEIGTGSGFQAAILDALGYRVFTIECVAGLYELASARFEKLGIPVQSRLGDGTLGWPEEAPFDAIIVTAAAPHEPYKLMSQLADGGVMILPLGSLASQQMTVIRRKGNRFEHEGFDHFAFVPLLGREGWPDSDE
ncbi:MAG TPA: protein-L-isoaspartate(D-aspartate) O-methyltransferase [Chlorobaculum parvum]|uniref:Protein-L-isoaspartate O-methyltransferase n=1 Tax=Chlorobaculum parvum TaxID=274539 RepID=A0A7C5DDR3_9CHLB|nr:protein-L-isoaspartate(D-aspartate) O-methyltransferase [Chlorobaculum parvum]